MRKHTKIWKKFSAIVLAAALVMGLTSVAAADETESERVTLNIAGQSDSEETAAETETDTEGEPLEEAEADTEQETDKEEEKERAEIPAVETGAGVVSTDVSAVVENCLPSVVTIGAVSSDTELISSGIIISQSADELEIATSYNAVSDASELYVCFYADGEESDEVPAKLKGSNGSCGVAVVAVQLDDIPEEVSGQIRIATLGSSAELKAGQSVIAIGNALGSGQIVTVGVISAPKRDVSEDGFYQEVIMTDNAYIAGVSGGPLLNTDGEVIGIMFAAESESGSLGYAIPIDTAIPVLETLSGKETRDKLSDAKRGYIGATVVDVTEDATQSYGMPAGAFVYSVSEGSAAEEAGIKNGDIITAIDGENVTGSSDLIDKMSYYAPGETVTLDVQTANNGNYESREVEVTLQAGENVDEEEEEGEDEEQDDSREDEYEDDYGDYYGFDDFYDFYDDFDDGFDDGFDDYNSQFAF